MSTPDREAEPKTRFFEVIKAHSQCVTVASSAADLALRWYEPSNEKDRRKIVKDEERNRSRAETHITRQGRKLLVAPNFADNPHGEKVGIEGDFPVQDVRTEGVTAQSPAGELLRDGDLVAISDMHNGELSVQLVHRPSEA